MKGASFQVIGVQEGLENAKGVESLFKKIITENFFKSRGGYIFLVQDGLRLSVKFNSASRQLIMKLSKVKNRAYS